MDLIWPTGGAIVLMLIAVRLAGVAASNGRIKRLIDKTPTSQISDMTTGHRAVYGRVVTTEPLLESPLTGRPCVYYKFSTFKGWGLSHFTSLTVESAPWAVDDGTGLAEVNSQHAEYSYQEDWDSDYGTEHESSGFDPLTDAEMLLDTYSKNSTGWMWRGTESILVIEAGNCLYVNGQVTVEDGRVCFDSTQDGLIISKCKRDVLLTYRWRAVRRWIASALFLTASVVCLSRLL